MKELEKEKIHSEIIEQRIFLIRGLKVIIDRDLSELYGVQTKYLNRQVKRNIERFPSEFMFQLNETERNELVTNWHRFSSLKHTKNLPYAFTGHGVTMIASVLNSEIAIKMSIQIVKIFVKLREIVISHKELNLKLLLLEEKVNKHVKDIYSIIEAIKFLMSAPEKKREPIGFKINK